MAVGNSGSSSGGRAPGSSESRLLVFTIAGRELYSSIVPAEASWTPEDICKCLSEVEPLPRWHAYVLLQAAQELPAGRPVQLAAGSVTELSAIAVPTMCPPDLEPHVSCCLEFGCGADGRPTVEDPTGKTTPNFLGDPKCDEGEGPGACFARDGDMVELPGTVDMAGPWTLSVWIHREKVNNGRWQTIACSHGATNNNFLMLQDGVFASYPHEVGVDCSSSGFHVSDMGPGWHHVAAVAEAAGQVQLFADGEKRGAPFEKLDPGLRLQFVGGSRRFSDAPFGLMDRFLVFAAALTAEQVAELYVVQRRAYVREPSAIAAPPSCPPAPPKCPPELEAHLACCLEFGRGADGRPTVVDSTGNTAPRFLGVPRFAEGARRGVHFARDGDMVELTQTLDMAGPWTLSVWIHREKVNSGRWQTIACSHGATNNNFLMLQDGAFASYPHEVGLDCSSSGFCVSDMGPGWHHVAAVAEAAGQVQLFVDGEKRGALFEKLDPGLRLQFVGGSRRFNDAPFGLLDGVLVFAAALTAAQVAALYSAQQQAYMCRTPELPAPRKTCDAT